jgi:hypothetical protein
MIDQIETLRSEHQTLDRVIHEEEVRPAPDESLLAQLKRRKLQLKDRIARLEHETLH